MDHRHGSEPPIPSWLQFDQDPHRQQEAPHSAPTPDHQQQVPRNEPAEAAQPPQAPQAPQAGQPPQSPQSPQPGRHRPPEERPEPWQHQPREISTGEAPEPMAPPPGFHGRSDFDHQAHSPRPPQPMAAPEHQPGPPRDSAQFAFTQAHGQPFTQAHGQPPTQPAAQPSPEFQLTPPSALDQSNLVNPVKAPPQRGWRRLVHRLSGARINPGSSKRDLEQQRLLEAVRTPLRGDYRIAVMSLKGGVGKTTTTVALGGVFASERGDRVIAIDANPDLGTLAQRVAAQGATTIRDLLNAEETVRYPQVRAYTNQAESRLEVIGSERDPAVSEAFSEQDYRRAIEILQHHYNVILTDCGTGLMHSAMSGVLDLANMLVLVTSPALDGAQSASATLDWLNMHGYDYLAANAVVVISSSAPGKPSVDVDQLIEHFRARTRAVHVIPYDKHLAEGATVDLDRLAKPTLQAYRELAATVAEDFGSPNHRDHH
ncbi:MinD/ParA family protein [Corynebacterium sp. HMSC29G08]|uniref:MinD/ParA family ATP-binding protein n=1 Tax=Corynebacterium sp. HMSC29G08 TaxID=1581069 RepID=UPI001FEE57F7|nr:MinD/ParA family protein [Corynebacterium sp. HMSC29G08]